MKLLTFSLLDDSAAARRLGVLSRDERMVHDLAAGAAAMGQATPAVLDMLGFLEGGEPAREEAQRISDWIARQQPAGCVHRADQVRWLAPVPRPRSIRDCMTVERHALQCMRAVVRDRCRPLAWLDGALSRWFGRGWLRVPEVWRERPVYYKGNPSSVVGHDAEVRWPSYTRRLDYELEFGIFIGRPGRNIPLERAAAHIGGYTIFNDFSARDVQVREMAARLGPSKGKDFDTGNAMGPCLVTADEIPDPYGLTMVARVNGVEWSRGTSAELGWSFEEMIAAISAEETLAPGEFIGSGAIGNGCGWEVDRWLAPGDVVELEVERLGILRNRIVAPDGGPSSIAPAGTRARARTARA